MELQNHFNWASGIDYEYTPGNHECECGDDYCRCGTIVSVEISVRLIDLVDWLAEQLKVESDIQKYGIDRLAVIHKLYEGYLFTGEVVGGYYGEEVGNITLDNEVFSAFHQDLSDFLSLEKLDQQIEFLLKLEYSFLPEKYTGRTWAVETVNPKSIELVNPLHFKKSGKSELYKGYPFFICICERKGSKQNIVDGYHRLAANFNQPEIKIITAL